MEREEFDFEISKWVDSIIRNGKVQQEDIKEEKGKTVKIEIRESRAKTEDIKIVYKIQIRNISKITGTIGKIVENIPTGLEYKQEDNLPYWTQEENKVVSTGLAGREIAPGAYAELEIVLRWKNGIENFGTKTNTVKIEQIASDIGFEEKSTDNNQSKAEVVMGITTGQKIIIEICWILMLIVIIIEAIAIKMLGLQKFQIRLKK